ncbi:MAG: DUF4340 domain-containing protein [Saprospiraceae bacterium]|nr:DUF4340 domain-containing protein [Saprospiraceae bacterium]MDW8229917.1 DUF4340 domain-containing protein [Saprospiraceae bacterium]
MNTLFSKRTGLLLALFLLVGGATYYLWQKNKRYETGSRIQPDMDFAVSDTNAIHRIFIADRRGRTADLKRQGDHWVYNDRYKARPSAVEVLLQTICCLNVLYVPPKAAEGNAVKALAADGIKVELYDRQNRLLKSYYVGDVTADERGTYMIMDGAEQPYVVYIPGFIGQVRVRYLLGDENWRDRMIFTEKPEKIQSISVEYPQHRSASFRLDKVGEAEYAVRPLFSTTPVSKAPQRKGAAEAYLLKYEFLGAEGFAHSDLNVDSIRALVPFAIVNLERTDRTSLKARFWPINVQVDAQTRQPFIIHYLTEVNEGQDYYITQHHVFGPIFQEYASFFVGASRLRN